MDRARLAFQFESQLLTTTAIIIENEDSTERINNELVFCINIWPSGFAEMVLNLKKHLLNMDIFTTTLKYLNKLRLKVGNCSPEVQSASRVPIPYDPG